MAPKGILILVMLAMVIGALLIWPDAKKWGFRPSGWLSLSLLIYIGLVLCGLF